MLGTTFLLAIKEIRRHLMRSFLTMLGVIIGVGSVVTMVTLGNGATAAIEAQISSLGTNLLTVRPGQGMGRGGGSSPAPFDEDDVEAVRTQIGGVLYVAPQATASATAIYEAQNWSTTVTGTTNDYFAASQLELAAGRFFTSAEETAGKSVCVIGETIRSALFDDADPLGKNIRLNDISCQIIGLLTKRGQAGFGLDPDDQAIMPVKTVMRRSTGDQDVGAFQVAVDPQYDSTAVSAAITELLRERRNLNPGTEDDFNIFDSKQLADTLSGTTQTLTLLLGAVAAVSLIVGGVGIMNIMLVSVTERTHEIGIRLAIGAVQREVLMQFLVEAVVLSSLGGIIGLVIALAATIGLSSLFSLPFIFNVQINLVSFAFAALIGIVFGYFPARRAAALNPIDALRHE